MLETTLGAIAIGLCALATIADVRTGRIPHVLTLPVVFIVPLVLVVGFGPKAALVSILGGVVAALMPGLLYFAARVGGGDVNLLAAIGVLLGPVAGLEAELLAFGIVLLYAAGVLAWRGKLGEAIVGGARTLRGGNELPEEWRVETRFAGAALAAVLLVMAARSLG